MKVFQVMFRGKTYKIAPEFGESVFMYLRNDYFYIILSGLEGKKEKK
jgi:hypothetical protein